jgi:DNA polymerase sigma
MSDFEFSCKNPQQQVNRIDRKVQALAKASMFNESARQSHYEQIQSSLRRLLSSDFKDGEIHFYGSRVIGVDTVQSDLDIFIDVERKFHSDYTISLEDLENLAKIEKILRKSPAWIVHSKIIKTTVPILKVKYGSLDLECKFKSFSINENVPIFYSAGDISVSNGLAVRNSQLLGHLFKIQPEAIKLVHFITEWMKAQVFNEFKRYTVTVLVLFYLQQRGLMPTIEEVHLGVTPEMIAGE